MTWLNDEQMGSVHSIRQAYAAALQAAEETKTPAALTALVEATALRARAMRMLTRETEVTVRQLAAMFRCSKQAVRRALDNESAEEVPHV